MNDTSVQLVAGHTIQIEERAGLKDEDDPEHACRAMHGPCMQSHGPCMQSPLA